MSATQQNRSNDGPARDGPVPNVRIPLHDPVHTAGVELELSRLNFYPSPELMFAQHDLQAAPSHLFTEELPKADSHSPASELKLLHSQEIVQSNFAQRANALVNAALGRVPDGMSVIDPDSILDESGRLYHGYKEGKYLLPNDAAEQDRLDLQHHLFKLVLDDWLAVAPMTRAPKYVLDIATGTGIWALEFAEQHPQSHVIGTDLSAIQPNRDIPNCVFQKDDSESEWVFRAPDRPYGILFDYVHLRMVCSCFDDTRQVMRQAYNNMNSGGWIEFQEIVYDTSVSTPLTRWYEGMNQGLLTIGRDITRPKMYKAWLEEVGFADVQQRSFVLPCNPWPEDRRLKEIGAFQMQNLFDGLKPIGWKMLKLAGWTNDGIDALISETKEYLRNVRNRPTAWILVAYGRKP